ncbi:MAG TPA: HAMP domain-containing sensor histidine kinase, partial [Gemmatimonadaceae bacterium]|nr:HAMP domain-containing sensor histidine kinase [Gemmatimonadaceae bacterium]
AASIAHEINNPLEAIINLHFLMRATDSREKLSEYLAMAEHELQRVAEITRQTLRFYRENGKLRSVDMAAVIESVLKLYDHRVMAKHVSIRRRLKPNVSVKGFSGELRQVLANLVSNALDAMPAGGTLYVRVTPCGTAPHGGSGVRVTVADTGKGIPREIRAKILEPFVSTKQETGTGLGLWISCEIIRKHGGTLRFRSREGRGTAFSIFLPCEPPHGEAAEGAQAPTLSEVSVPPVA